MKTCFIYFKELRIEGKGLQQVLCNWSKSLNICNTKTKSNSKSINSIFSVSIPREWKLFALGRKTIFCKNKHLSTQNSLSNKVGL